MADGLAERGGGPDGYAAIPVLTCKAHVQGRMEIRACAACGRDMKPTPDMLRKPAVERECEGCGHVAVPIVFGDFGSWEAFATSRQQALEH